MNSSLKNKLIKIAKNKIKNNDPSHDFYHSWRVFLLAKKIAKTEKSDLDIIIPAALFHDIINYPKNDKRRNLSSDKSAEYTEKILKKINDYPKEKIEFVCLAIKMCSFSKAIAPDFIEARILQDADGLEATGAISIMRTFSSAGQLKRTFYNYSDPFCEKRNSDDSKYALDLFFSRLLQIKNRLHTKKAKNIVKRRIIFLKKFLHELRLELTGS